MSKCAHVLWIDDDPEGRSDQLLLLNANRRRLRAEMVGPEDLDDHLRKIKASAASEPYLFLVDYLLDRKRPGPWHRGATVAGKLRDAFPGLPIYMVSDAFSDTSGEALTAWELFDKAIPLSYLAQRDAFEQLSSDARDYLMLRLAAGSTPEALLDLVDPPESARAQVLQALPDELRDGISLGARPLETRDEVILAARWIRERLIGIPGILYDELRAATLLGMTESFFRKKSQTFAKARYKGLFSETSSTRWWRAALVDKVVGMKAAKKMDSSAVGELSPEVFKVPQGDRPKCVVCGGPFPETVGLELAVNKDVWKPIHLGCSQPHPGKLRQPQFEDTRVYES